MGIINEPKQDELADYEWMIRPCELYKDEYKDCTSIKARFHQYFIHGETIDCTQWKKDYDNCYRWTSDNDKKSMEALIQSEIERKRKRLKAHYDNNIWEKRDKPPNDWNRPLPEWLTKRDENSYLAEKAKQLRGEPSNFDLYKKQMCSIM